MIVASGPIAGRPPAGIRLQTEGRPTGPSLGSATPLNPPRSTTERPHAHSTPSSASALSRSGFSDQWTSCRVARLRRTEEGWQVDGADRNGRWYRCDHLPAVPSLDEALTVLDDPRHAFWG
ncbi:DUF3024 domain-containing protein [Streptomyces mirabilis]|uniref:DUF3024 domain-containing protein n=1 Tax=Streptomyces mirabilis TaxID=68239 RepID=UPI0036A3E91B